MSGTAAPQFRAGTGRSTVVAAALVLVLLAPVAFLFLQAYGSLSDRRAATEREIEGVAYLRALGQLAFTVADAQSASISGRQTDRGALTTAVTQVAAVDERYGVSLRTRERWTGLRGAIERTGNAPAQRPDQALAAYNEISGLMLALYGKVRDESGLVHDPDADAYQLQESVATYLPAAVIAAGQLADLTTLPPAPTPEQQLATQGELALARVTLQSTTARLVEGLRSAADDTESRTLGGNLLSSIDAYQLAAGELIAGTGMAGLPTSDLSLIPVKRGAVQTAADGLSTTILNEIDRLLQDRRDGLDRERLLLLVVAALVLLLAALAVVVLFTGWRRARRLDDPSLLAPPENRPAWGPTRAEELARRERAGAAR